MSKTRFEEYARHILMNRDYVRTRLGKVVSVYQDAVDVRHYSTDLSETYLSWPGCKYEVNDDVVCFVPPDDVAVAIPVEKSSRRQSASMLSLMLKG